MKRAISIGSWMCVALGISAIFFAFIETSSVMTIIFLALYFVGIPVAFTIILPKKEAKKISQGTIVAVFNKRFWIAISLGVFAGALIAMTLQILFELSIGATILIGLGLSAILTSFTTPDYKEVDPIQPFE